MAGRTGALTLLAGAFLAFGMCPGLADKIVQPADCPADDASQCLQDAIAKAAASYASVVIAPGVYMLRRPLQLATSVSLVGSSGTILQPSLDNSEGVLLVYGSKVHDIRIEGITFDGGGKDFPTESFMIDLDGTQNVVLDGVTLRHSRGTALAVLGSNGGEESRGNGVENSHVFDVGNHWRTTLATSGRKMAVSFWDGSPPMSQANFARNNRFEDTGLDAIQVAGQQGFVGEGNVFTLDNGQRDLLKAGDYPAAFFAETDADLTIRDNVIHGALGNCIDLPGVTGATIEDNYIYGCGQSGIGVFQDYDFNRVNSSDIVIRGNIILNSAIWPASVWKAGISIGGGKPKNIQISGNLITDMRPKGQRTQDYGIEVVNDPQANIVTKVTGLKIGDDNRLDGNQRAKTHGVP